AVEGEHLAPQEVRHGHTTRREPDGGKCPILSINVIDAQAAVLDADLRYDVGGRAPPPRAIPPAPADPVPRPNRHPPRAIHATGRATSMTSATMPPSSCETGSSSTRSSATRRAPMAVRA